MVRLIRKALPLLTVVVILAAAYDAWIFYSRWSSSRQQEHEIQKKEADNDRRAIEMLGGGRLKILSFYGSPTVIPRGGHANICYGVYGAKSVRIEPPVEELHPAVPHCLQVSPAASTEYTLVAEDDRGHVAKEQFTLRVTPY